MCVDIPFILDVILLVDEPTGVTQEECHTLHVPPAALVLLFIARRIQPSHSLVDRKVEISGTQALIVLHLLGYIFLLVCFIYRAYIYIYIYIRKIPVRVTASRFEPTSSTSEGFEVTN